MHSPMQRMTLAQALDAKKLKKVELARKSGVHKSTVSRLVAGLVRPEHDTVVKLESALGVRPGTLTFGKAA